MIRFFISSTFEDMVEEREAIHRNFYPVVREYGLQKGVNVDICDLRWGINFDNKEDGKDFITEIMRVCFHEVRDCRPYMIAILGDRYGTAPADQELIRKQWVELGGKKSAIPTGNISLTQWELEFSFLSGSNVDSNALCMLRDDPVEMRDDEAVVLKSRILKAGHPFNTGKDGDRKTGNLKKIMHSNYESIDSFVETLIEYAKVVIDREADEEDQKNWVTQEMKYARAYCKDRVKEFSGREKNIRSFRKFVKDPEGRILALYGPSGIGKSSLMSKLYSMDLGDYEKSIITCGASQNSSRYVKVIQEIIYLIEEELYDGKQKLRDNIFTEGKAENQLEEVLGLLRDEKKEKKIIIFIDAMDKMQIAAENHLIDIFLRVNASNIKLVCTQIEAVQDKQKEGLQVVKVNSLSKSEATGILRKKLYNTKQKSGSGTDVVIEAILKKKDAAIPLYINTVNNILKMHMADLTDPDKKNELFVSRIAEMPETVTDICRFAIAQSIEYILPGNARGSKRKRKMMARAMSAIAASKHGLRDYDLEKIFEGQGWESVLFSNIRQYLSDFFRMQSDGCWMFEHDIITRSLMEIEEPVTVGKTGSEVGVDFETAEEAKKNIYSYIMSDKCEDIELKIREGIALSYYFGNGDLAITMLENTGTETIAIRGIAARELLDVLQRDFNDLWLRLLIQTDTVRLTHAMGGLLEQIGGAEDFERRIPAKRIADHFLRLMDIHTEDDVNDCIRKNAKTLDEEYDMIFFFTEYVYACESAGCRMRAYEFLFAPIKFYLGKEAKELSKEKKKRATAHMNGLLYVNNLIINQLKKASKELIEWYKKDPYKTVIEDKTVEALFIGNTAQYYSAVDKPDEGVSYRLNSIHIRSENLFSLIGGTKELSHERFAEMCGETQTSLAKFNIDGHGDFWKRVEEYIEDMDFDEKTTEQISNQWMRLALGYRNIAYDIEMYNDTKGDYSEMVDFGCDCAEIAIQLMSSPFMQNELELWSSEIRWIRISSKKLRLSKEKVNELINCCETCTEQYLNNNHFFGENRGETLYDTLKMIRSLLQKRKMDQTDIINLMDVVRVDIGGQ